MPLLINEIFYSIQGESLNSGRPCIFIRLSGCNLRCRYCDTTYAYEDGKWMSTLDILEQAASFRCNLVEITGGEPLLQPEAPSLMALFLDSGYEVMVETNGSLDISVVPSQCMKIVDMKCPSSGESNKNDYENMARLSPQDQIKFVIGNRSDYEFARSVIEKKPPFLPMHHILFGPVANELSPGILADWILADHLPVRFHTQLHKAIWPNESRGR